MSKSQIKRIDVQPEAPVDAPIRQACHADTLCRTCTRILDYGCEMSTEKQIRDGFVVVVRCGNYREAS